MSGPPARPSLTGRGMPGSSSGMLPRKTPSAMPRKRGMRLGSLSRFMELPSTFSTASMAAGVPTTLTRSPTCRLSRGVATRSIPARLIRVMLMPPHDWRRRSSPRRLPLISGLVTRMRRLSSSLSRRSHSSCLRGASSPTKVRTVGASCSVVMTRTRSSSWRTVWPETISVRPSLQ